MSTFFNILGFEYFVNEESRKLQLYITSLTVSWDESSASETFDLVLHEKNLDPQAKTQILQRGPHLVIHTGQHSTLQEKSNSVVGAEVAS